MCLHCLERMYSRGESNPLQEWQIQQRWEGNLPEVLEKTKCCVAVLNDLAIIDDSKQKTDCKTEGTRTHEGALGGRKDYDDNDKNTVQNVLGYDDSIPEDMIALIGEMKNGSVLALMKFRLMMKKALGDMPDDVQECGQSNEYMPASFVY